MPRYIDADKVMDEINRIGGHNLCEWETIGVKALIDRQPTADVVPKSEYIQQIAEVQGLRQALLESKTEYAREIFEEIDQIFRRQYELCSQTDFKLLEPILQGERFTINEMWHKVAKLKKKYTEENV